MKEDDEDNKARRNAGRPARATTDTTNNHHSEPKEGFGQKVSRGFANCCFCCFKFKEQTQISALEFKIANRQKKFGVDYLTLVEQKASQGALKECLQVALRDISELQTQANEHYDSIDRKKEEVQNKTEDAATRAATRAAPTAAQPKKKPVQQVNRSNNSSSNPKDTPDANQKKGPTKKESTQKKKKKAGGKKPDERFSIDDE